MKAKDFDLSKEIKFDTNTGITKFKHSRLVIFDTNAIGLLRYMLIRDFGMEKARDLFLQFGFQNGYADFMQMKLNYKFDSEMELLSAGPVMHTWEGIVHVTVKDFSFDRKKGHFYHLGIWRNSYEAEQHLSYLEAGKEPVCWSLMGYASGWCTAFFGKLLVGLEPTCMGKGDDCCEILIKPPSEWDDAAKPYLESYKKVYNVKGD